MNKAAQELGTKGGMAKSEAKTKAARANAKKPRKKWVTSIAYELEGVEKYKAFGSVLVRGKPPADAEKSMWWCSEQVVKNGVGLADEPAIVFSQLATTSMRV